MKKTSLVLLMSLYLIANGQKIVFETDLGQYKLGKVMGANSGDSTFLTFDILKNIVDRPVVGNKSYWLLSNGEHQPIDLSELAGKALLNISVGSDSTYYYFVESYKKETMIKALVVSRSLERRISKQQFILGAKLYGSYVENGDLYLLTAEKSTFDLNLIQLHGLTKLGQKKFTLPFDLGKNKKSDISFYEAGSPIQPSQAIALIKIIKDKDAIFISVDEPLPEYHDENPPTTFRTIILRLDLVTGEVTNVIFFESAGNFISTISNGYLYRLVQQDGFRVDVYDLTNNKKIWSRFLSDQVEYPGQLVYSRNGKDLIVRKGIGVKRVVKGPFQGYILGDQVGVDSIVLSLGNHIEISPRVPSLLPFGLAGALVPLIVNEVINDLNDGPRFYQYFYLNGSVAHGFNLAKNLIGLRRQKIDEYEIQRGNIFTYKAYWNNPGLTYSIYQFKKSSTVQVVQFE